jgi:hypothetical protein
MTGDETTVNGALVTGTAGTAVTENFGSTEMARSAEVGVSAASSAAIAEIQARYIVAQRRPRDLDTVRLALLKECRRPSFAAVARYRKPIGEGIEGPSIRFAEAAMRALGNITPKVKIAHDDPEKRIVTVSVTDLENNLNFEGDIVVDKTVERSKLKDGQVPIRVRKNSVGKTTYVVEATEDELLAKQGALVSKMMREHALRILPGDLKDECMETVLDTLEREDAADPSAARKKLVDAFDRMGVKPTALRDYLGHDLDGVTPAELTELRAVAAAIRDGESTWKDVLDHKLRTKQANTPDAEKPATVKDKAKAKAAEGKPLTQPALVEDQASLIGDTVKPTTTAA